MTTLNMPTQIPSSSAALLIEPDPDLAGTFRELMTLAYHSSVTLDAVASLHDGLMYLQTHHVPVILMNLSLPEHAGREAVERVRQAAGSSAIIGFQRTPDAAMLSHAIRAGAHEILPVTPPSAETLRLSITSALLRATRPLTSTEPLPSSDAPPASSVSIRKAAHDLNNCLTSINGFADILLARLPADDPSHRFAEQIKLACARAENVIKQLPRTADPPSASPQSQPTDSARAA